jgi:hypothetical protein
MEMFFFFKRTRVKEMGSGKIVTDIFNAYKDRGLV